MTGVEGCKTNPVYPLGPCGQMERFQTGWGHAIRLLAALFSKEAKLHRAQRPLWQYILETMNLVRVEIVNKN
jgi:hypothetical protein